MHKKNALYHTLQKFVSNNFLAHGVVSWNPIKCMEILIRICSGHCKPKHKSNYNYFERMRNSPSVKQIQCVIFNLVLQHQKYQNLIVSKNTFPTTRTEKKYI